jgi:hypothetical protein
MRQFDRYAAASRFTMKGAEVEIGIFVSSHGPGVTEIFDAFGLSAQEEKVVATIRGTFYARQEYFTTKVEFVQDVTIGKPEI